MRKFLEWLMVDGQDAAARQRPSPDVGTRARSASLKRLTVLAVNSGWGWCLIVGWIGAGWIGQGRLLSAAATPR